MKKHECEQREECKLYRIGMFSQWNRLTVKTLRYYDEMNVFKPEYVDENNGYRYYTSAQLPQLHKLIALRDMDFSIQEIQAILQGASEQDMLMKKKHHLLQTMAELNQKLATLEGYASDNYKSNDYTCIVKELPEVCVAYMKVKLNSYDELFYKMPDMGNCMEQAGCECVEPDTCFTMYYDGGYRESDIHAELCQVVREAKEDGEQLKFRMMPRVKEAVCILHKGSYETLPQTYGALVKFIEESGYEIIGEQRELYIDGVWNRESPQDWLTEIQFPVRKLRR